MVPYLYLFVLLQFFSLSINAQTYPAKREALGKVKASALAELSGIIPSQAYPDCFWTHNDSGDRAQLFLIDKKAELQGTYVLEDIDAIDIEDIARFTKDGKTYLVLADIGDNRAVRKHISLYIFEEPSWRAESRQYRIARADIQVLEMRYADKPRDAEALFIDPIDQQGYLVSKRDFQSQLYTFELAPNSPQPQVVKAKLALPFTFITAADISANGRHLLMKNLTEIFYWPRPATLSIAEALAQPYTKIAYSPEPQGEAICFGDNPAVFFTISERPLGLDAYLYRYTIDFYE